MLEWAAKNALFERPRCLGGKERDIRKRPAQNALLAQNALQTSPTHRLNPPLLTLVSLVQGIGYLLAPALGLVAILLFPDSSSTWRFMLGIGALPISLLLLSTACSPQRSASAEGSPPASSSSLVHAIRNEPDILRKLAGTAGCWFLFDVLFYGNTLFKPVVLKAAFGPSETLVKTALHDLCLNAMSLPGYFMSIKYISSLGARRVQSNGFFAMFVIYLIIGIGWSAITALPPLLLIFYGSTFFFANFGPNSTTFILPSVTFSPTCKSTLNGVSAACGKAGALLGALVFQPATDVIGAGPVMIVCGGISIAGLLLTLFCVPDKQASDEETVAGDFELTELTETTIPPTTP